MSLALYAEDCIHGMRERLAPGSVDVLITSPPYNRGIRYGTYRDRLPRPVYLEWTALWLDEAQRALSPDGSFFFNFDAPCADRWLSHDVLTLCRARFELQNVFIWVKSYSPDLEAREPCRGHCTPLRSDRFTAHSWEHVWHFTKTGRAPLDRLAVGVRFADESNLKRGTRGANGNVRDAGDVWPLPYETISQRATDRPHPATFPVALPERCIRLHGVERARLVVDPFVGLGSSLLACQSVGVPGIGWEIDAGYAELARQRLGLANELREAA